MRKSIAEMRSRERLLRAMRCQEVDRVPVRLWGVDPFTTACGEASYAPLYELAESQCDQMIFWSPPSSFGAGVSFGLNGSGELRCRTFDQASPHEGYVERVTVVDTPEGELRSTWLRHMGGGPGRAKEYLIKSRRDVSAFLSIPWEPLHPPVDSFFDLERKLGDRALPVVDTAGDPIYHVYSLLGSELLALWSVEYRGLIQELAEVLARRWIEYLRFLVERGAGPVFGIIGPEVCLPPLQSMRDFEQFVAQVDGKAMELVHGTGGLVWVHCHGRMNGVLERFIEMGVDCLNPVEPPPMGDIMLSDAKKMAGGRMCLEGNVEVGCFETMTGEAFREMCLDAIRAGKPGGGYIYCATSTHTHWPRLSPRVVENYRIFVEVGRLHGRYVEV